METALKVCGLFAGIGGIERGLAAAGHETLLLCELWAAARAVLDVRFPNIPKFDDVVALNAVPEATELLTAGFPCQDLSQAGLTQGVEGTQSALVSNIFRLIDRQPIPIVLLENVSFMLRLNRGKAMARLVEAFEQRGYSWAYRVVNSLSFVPQRRERVFLVASKAEVRPWEVLFADETHWQAPETQLDTHAHGFYWTEGTRGLGWAPDSIPPLKNGSTVGIPSPPAIVLPSGLVIKPDLRDAERLQGFPEDWTEPAAATGRSSLRWALVGNAVTVPVAQWLGERLKTPGVYDTGRDRDDFPVAPWPSAARCDLKKRYAVTIAPTPIAHQRSALHNFLNHPGTPLSVRAARGFLKRAEASTLRFVPGFKEKIRAHLATMEAVTGVAEYR